MKITRYRIEIDLLKALAIISVIILHTIPRDLLLSLQSQFHIWQAVPVFMILMGYTFSLSNTSVRYLKLSYWLNKVNRFFIPVAIFYIFSYLLQQFNETGVKWRLFFDLIPVPQGPGSYFILIVFQALVVLPILHSIYRKLNSDILFLTITFFMNLLFEISAPHIKIFLSDNITYSSMIFRYLFALSLGMVLYHQDHASYILKLIILIGFIFSTIYLYVWGINHITIPWFIPLWKWQNLFTFFYSVIFVSLLLKILTFNYNNFFTSFFALIGKASLHIFLFQILFFGTPLFKNTFALLKFIEMYNIQGKVIAGIILNIIFGISWYLIENTILRKVHVNKRTV